MEILTSILSLSRKGKAKESVSAETLLQRWKLGFVRLSRSRGED
jgi:hypothetical protein